MSLLATDQALTRHSYYTATAARASYPALDGRRQLRRRHGRRWPGRPVGGDRPAPTAASRSCCSKHARSAAAPAAATAARRSTAWPATRRRSRLSWARTTPGASGTCRSRRSTCCASACRDTPSPATGATATWAWPPARARAAHCGLGRPHRGGLPLPAAAHRAGGDRTLDRQPALPQRHPRPALGPPAPAEVHAGPGPRRGRCRRAHPRADGRAGPGPGRPACLAHRRRQRERAAGPAGRQRLSARRRAAARAAHHAGGNLHRLQRGRWTPRWPTA